MKKDKETPKKAKAPGRKSLGVGIFFLLVSFCSAGGMVFLLMENLSRRKEEVQLLQEKIDVVSEEKDRIQQDNRELAAQLGSSVSVDKIISEAEKIYSDDVKSAKEGYLWVDRSSSNWIVTLGALNGLAAGSRLGVYNGDEKIATVEVSVPLDVISYVLPTDTLKNQYKQDYFRVAEE
jgi:hypothetical protein